MATDDLLKDLNDQQAVMNLDATPDEGYVLRILQAYRDNCNVKWATSTDGTCDNPLYQTMNEHQEERAKLLDSAIEKLKDEQLFKIR